MEELYQLIEERLLQIKTAYDKFNLIANQRDHLNSDSLSTSGSDVRDLSQYMSQIKRLEKIRTFKENELMEAFSALKSFDSTQKKRFHEKTYYFMKLIRTDFVYAKYKQSEEIKDVAKLFLHFFLHCNMQGKIEEIKKVYSSTKCAGHSFLFLLMKWLIEITRNTLQNLLKEKIQQIPIVAPAKTEKPFGAVPTRIINKIGLTGLRSRSVSKPNASTTSRPQPSTLQNSPKNGSREVKTPPENLNELPVRQTAATVNVLKDEEEENNDQNEILLDQQQQEQQIILDNDIMTTPPLEEKENTPDLIVNYQSEPKFKPIVPVSMVEDSTFNFDTTGCFSNHSHQSPQQPQSQPQSQSRYHQESHEQLPTVVLNTKHVKKNPFIYNIEGSQVQLYYGNINAINNYSSLVEDLDIVQASYAYQFLPPKNPRMSKTGTFVTLDMERRKEFINKVFKDLYARNADIEKHAAAYQADLLQERIWSYPHPTNVRKGENFCENITLNFPKMFPQLIPDEEMDTDSIPLKGKFARAMNPHRNRKKSDVTSLTLHQKNNSQQQNSKGPRSESSYNSRTQRKSYMDILLNKIQGNRQQPENDDNTGDGQNPNFGYRTENRFRIMKKKMSIYHEVRDYPSPNKSQRAKASNNSNISNNANNTGNKLMTEASGFLTPDHFSQAITEVLNYIPNMQKEMSEVVQKSSTNNPQNTSNTPQYSIYTGNRSTSINKIRPAPGGEYTIWDSLNQSKVVIPEKVTKRLKNKNENFNLLHANDIIQANSVGYETHRISPHSNRAAEKTKR